MHPFKAGLEYFVLVFGAGFLLGMVRVPFLVPRLGERWAELLEMPIMAIVIVLAARRIVRRHGLPAKAAPRIVAGAVAIGLVLIAELLLAVAIEGRSVAEYLASRDPVSGSVYLVLLAFFAAMPFILARWGARR